MEDACPQITDLPLVSLGEDCLGHRTLVHSLMTMAIDKNSRTPLTVMLDGPEGIGKTSILQMTADALRQHHNRFLEQPAAYQETHRPCKPFFFSAWKYSRDNSLLQGLLLEMMRHLENDSELWEAAQIEADPKALIQDFSEKIYEIPLQQRSALLEEFVLFIRKVVSRFTMGRTGEEGDQWGIFLTQIDDLDRCSPAQVFELMDFIHMFFSVPGFVFVLGLDFQSFHSKLLQEWKQQGNEPEEAESYLRKIIQLHIRIPVLDPQHGRTFIDNLCRGNDNLTTLLDEPVREVFSKSPLPNLRELKRAVNFFLFENVLHPPEESPDAKSTLAKESVLKALEPDLYETLKNQPFYMVAWQSYISWKSDPQNNQGFEWETKNLYWDEWERWHMQEPEEKYGNQQDSDTVKVWTSHPLYLRQWEVFFENWKHRPWFQTAEFLLIGTANQPNLTIPPATDTGENPQNPEQTQTRQAYGITKTLMGYEIRPGCNLENAQLENAQLELADLKEANLHKAMLSHSNLTQANLNKAQVTEADLSEAQMTEIDLSESDLKKANMEGAYLLKANLNKADLRGANLKNAILRQAEMKRTKLAGTNLEDANLSSANLTGTNLNGALLRGTNFKGANLTGTRFDLQEIILATNLRSAKFDPGVWTEISKLLAKQ